MQEWRADSPVCPSPWCTSSYGAHHSTDSPYRPFKRCRRWQAQRRHSSRSYWVSVDEGCEIAVCNRRKTRMIPTRCDSNQSLINSLLNFLAERRGICEPCPRSFSLQSVKITGNWTVSLTNVEFGSPKTVAQSAICARIPYPTEQGIKSDYQRINSAKQEICSVVAHSPDISRSVCMGGECCHLFVARPGAFNQIPSSTRSGMDGSWQTTIFSGSARAIAKASVNRAGSFLRQKVRADNVHVVGSSP